MPAPRVDEQRRLRTLAVATVRRLWMVRPADLIETRDMLLAELPGVVATFGDVAATLAADQFEDIANRSAVLAEPTPPDAIRASTRWALTPMFSGTPNIVATLARLAEFVDRDVLRQGDETIFASTARHRLRYVWVPSGPTCGWCTMKASRGAVYHSSAAAVAGRHANCDCTAQPVASDADLTRLQVEHGYDQSGALEAYRAAADNVGTRSPARVASEIDRLRVAS